MAATTGLDQRRSSMEENIAPGNELYGDFDTPSKPANVRSANRHAAVNNSLLSNLQATASPSQAKKALEAHMLETDRRLEETSKLGTALVHQRNELADRMKEVEKAQSERQLGPQLRQKLADVEKEYNELGRDSAAFLAPRRGHASEDFGQDEGVTSTLRSASPTKFNARATDSPTKMSAVERKTRHLTASRMADIEFATDISTSLLAQVRQLQGALAERDASLKAVTSEKERMLLDMQTHGLRMRSLDESEQKYKDENWTLETQRQELLAAQKDAAEKEQRLQHSLAVANAEKTAAQRELDEMKQAHGKLSEEAITSRKAHENELGSLRKSVTVAESDRAALKKRLEELVSHNQELANMIHMRPRSTELGMEREVMSDPDDLSLEKSDMEHPSPPGSPVKGARNSMLESETLKNSLTHAHRMIQTLKGSIHREKTEKLELRRQLQDTRDELDIKRKGIPGLKGKTRDLKQQSSKPSQLGGSRTANMEVIEGEDWEDSEAGPTPKRTAGLDRIDSNVETSEAYATATENEAFDTANETETDAGFETATERDAPTDSEFVTGNEDSAGEETETEDSAVARGGTIRGKPTPVRPSRNSFHSTASTSDEDSTPLRNSKYGSTTFRNKPGGSRWSVMGQHSAQSSIKGSPASFAPGGHSLGDELGDFLDDDSVDGSSVGDANTPSRNRAISSQRSRSGTPRTPSKRSLGPLGDGIVLHPIPQIPPVPKAPMVDCAISTDAWEPETIVKTETIERIVHVDRPVEVQVTVPGPERIVRVPEPYEVVREVQVPFETIREVQVPFETIREVQVPFETIREVEVVKERIVYVDRPVEVEVKVPATPIKAETTDMGTIMTPSKQTEFADTATSPRDADFAAESLPTPEETPVNSIANLRSLDGPAVDVRNPETSLFAPQLEHRKFEASTVRSISIEPRDVPAKASRKLEQTKVQSIADIPPAQNSSRPTTASKDKNFSFAPIYTPTNPPPDAAQELSRPATAVKEGDNHTLEKAAGSQSGQQPLGEQLSNNAAGKSPEPTTPHQQTRGQTSPSDDVFGPTPASQASPKPILPSKSVRRPGSVNSLRRSKEVPPLPADHQKVIEAASKRNTAELPRGVTTGAMGPPLASASAMRASQMRSATPQDQFTYTPTGNAPRARQMRSAKSLNSRRSSISSFESELDRTFQLRNAMGAAYPPGIDAGTDPRMIQAITQTMIGEYLWKYTRKAGGSKMSANRHRRFFWVHPYTRTLYWSEQDPATAGRAQLKAKSVQIEAVRVVQDDNPFPPGLHRKSLIVLTPSGGRDLKFTAPTGMRHETWFNSLSYLLLRQNPDAAQESVATHQDFNPTQALMGKDLRGETDRMSLSTYNSRPGTQRGSSRAGSVNRIGSPMRGGASSIMSGSPATIRHHPMNARDTASSRPTSSRSQDLAPRSSAAHGRNSMSIASRISGYIRSGRQSINERAPEEGPADSIYNANVVQSESAEDLRRQYEQSIEEEDESAGVENVRACCDGSHDVGSISRRAGSRVSSQHHH